MQTQADRKYSYLPPLIAGIVVVLFSTAGVARMLGWSPTSTAEASVSVASEAPATPRCPECAVILSIRESERQSSDSGIGDKALVKPARNYEIAVRMADGSNRVINAANPARWRTGERLIVIGDGKPSSR